MSTGVRMNGTNLDSVWADVKGADYVSDEGPDILKGLWVDAPGAVHQQHDVSLG